jgi:hypothetical protein
MLAVRTRPSTVRLIRSAQTSRSRPGRNAIVSIRPDRTRSNARIRGHVEQVVRPSCFGSPYSDTVKRRRSLSPAIGAAVTVLRNDAFAQRGCSTSLAMPQHPLRDDLRQCHSAGLTRSFRRTAVAGRVLNGENVVKLFDWCLAHGLAPQLGRSTCSSHWRRTSARVDPRSATSVVELNSPKTVSPVVQATNTNSAAKLWLLTQTVSKSGGRPIHIPPPCRRR